MKKRFSRFRNADPRCKSIRSIPPRTAASYADTSNSPQINCIVFQDKRLQTFTIRSGTGEISIDPVSKCNTPRFPGIFLNPASPRKSLADNFLRTQEFRTSERHIFFSSPPSSIIHELFKKRILKISDRIDFISRIYTLSCIFESCFEGKLEISIQDFEISKKSLSKEGERGTQVRG